jgi:hypothetical protein
VFLALARHHDVFPLLLVLPFSFNLTTTNLLWIWAQAPYDIWPIFGYILIIPLHSSGDILHVEILTQAKLDLLPNHLMSAPVATRLLLDEVLDSLVRCFGVGLHYSCRHAGILRIPMDIETKVLGLYSGFGGCSVGKSQGFECLGILSDLFCEPLESGLGDF